MWQEARRQEKSCPHELKDETCTHEALRPPTPDSRSPTLEHNRASPLRKKSRKTRKKRKNKNKAANRRTSPREERRAGEKKGGRAKETHHFAHEKRRGARDFGEKDTEHIAAGEVGIFWQERVEGELTLPQQQVGPSARDGERPVDYPHGQLLCFDRRRESAGDECPPGAARVPDG